MRVKIAAIAALAILVVSGSATAQNLYITGQDFLQFDEFVQGMYVAGLSDGVNMAIGEGFETGQWHADCTVVATPKNLADNLVRWLDNNPDQLEQGAAFSYVTATAETCGLLLE
jgi:hypothetical protein